jgi:hypothetical protein
LGYKSLLLWQLLASLSGRKKIRDEGLTEKGTWVTKTGAAAGGKLTKNQRTSHKELDSGEKVDIILSTETCSLKTK